MKKKKERDKGGKRNRERRPEMSPECHYKMKIYLKVL